MGASIASRSTFTVDADAESVVALSASIGESTRQPAPRPNPYRDVARPRLCLGTSDVQRHSLVREHGPNLERAT